MGEGTEADEPSVFGEEAHIVGRSRGGPRAGRHAGDIDGYGNLILLCSRHHKEVDDQVNTFTVDWLHEIKRDHETWVAKLGEKKTSGRMRWVPDPAHPVPKRLDVFTSGTAFWHYFARGYSFTSSWPEGLSDEHEDLIVGFLQDLKDWMDITDDSYTMARDASKAMDRHVIDLAKAGFLLAARRRHYLLTTDGSDDPADPWISIDIEIQPTHIAFMAWMEAEIQP